MELEAALVVYLTEVGEEAVKEVHLEFLGHRHLQRTDLHLILL